MHHSSTETAAAGGQPLLILQQKTEDMQCHVAAGFDQKKSFAVDSVQLETVDGRQAKKGMF